MTETRSGPSPGGGPTGPDPTHVAAVAELAAAATPALGACTVVAIDGLSGAGKTTLAAAVAAHLGAPVLHMDEFYPGWAGLQAGVTLVTTLVLHPLSQGRDAAYRRWDWVAGRWGEAVALPWVPRLVLEGCGSSAAEAGRYAAVRVWVQADPVVRRRRGLARDGAVYEPHWQQWAEQELSLFTRERTRERADLVLDTTPHPRTPSG